MTREQLEQRVEELEKRVATLHEALKVGSKRDTNQDDLLRVMADRLTQLETVLGAHQRIFEALQTDRRLKNVTN